MKRRRLLLGISVLWLALSAVFDGMSSLVLPSQLLGTGDESSRATSLGLVTFVGLLAAMLVQPIARAFGDRLRPHRGRMPVLALGVGLLLATLALFGATSAPVVVYLAYLLVQVAARFAQSAQQGFIPDLVDEESLKV